MTGGFVSSDGTCSDGTANHGDAHGRGCCNGRGALGLGTFGEVLLEFGFSRSDFDEEDVADLRECEVGVGFLDKVKGGVGREVIGGVAVVVEENGVGTFDTEVGRYFLAAQEEENVFPLGEEGGSHRWRCSVLLRLCRC